MSDEIKELREKYSINNSEMGRLCLIEYYAAKEKESRVQAAYTMNEQILKLEKELKDGASQETTVD